MIATAPVAESMEENDGTFYSTYGWHPRSVVAAIATLRNLKANRPRVLAGVAEMSEYFRVRLLQLEFDRPATVRIQGLAIGIDVGDEPLRGPWSTRMLGGQLDCLNLTFQPSEHLEPQAKRTSSDSRMRTIDVSGPATRVGPKSTA